MLLGSAAASGSNLTLLVLVTVLQISSSHAAFRCALQHSAAFSMKLSPENRDQTAVFSPQVATNRLLFVECPRGPLGNCYRNSGVAELRWRGRERERSENVEDLRGISPQMAIGGGGGLLAVVVMLVLKFMGAGQGVQQMAGQIVNNVQQQGAQAPSGAEGLDDDHREFCQVVLADTEKVWGEIFARQIEGVDYVAPKLIMFSGATQTACGQGQSAMGPFYCPGDQQVYIDPTFFDDLAQRHQAPGDFTQAYVLAHEVAHHVQKLLGFSDAMHAVRARGDELETNHHSVRLELQADFLAGVWAHHAHRSFDILEEGDMEEAINAANRIGDDTLQKEATGRVDLHSFTHGSSAQRVRWFKKGLLSGRVELAQPIWKGIAYEDL